MIRKLSLLMLLFCSACIQLGGETQPTRFYLLEPVSEEQNQSLTEIQLEISPIGFHSYLDRPQIDTRNSDNLIQIADYDRWAEPLADNFIRTLQENLRQHTGIRISSAPWTNNIRPDYSLKLSINRFDGTLGQQTDVDIRWSLVALANNEEIARQHFKDQRPIGTSYQEFVKGLNKALTQLSQKINAAILAVQ